MRLPLERIRLDGGTFPRARLDRATVIEYAESMRSGHHFPPVTVFHDGTDYWLADGFHRVDAARGLNFRDIDVDVKIGTLREAILYAVGANATHGLRRTPADKRHAVTLMLSDSEWGKWSDRAIARVTVTSHPLVAKMRASLAGNVIENVTGNVSSERQYTTKHGTTAVMDTSRIGKSSPPATRPLRLSPDLRERLREYQRQLGLDTLEDTLARLLETSSGPAEVLDVTAPPVPARRPTAVSPTTRRWLGIDPGLASLGWAVLFGEEDDARLPSVIDRGTIKTGAKLSTPERLLELEGDLVWLLREFEPTDVALELPLGNPNPKTERTVSEAIGVIHLVCYRERGIVPVHLFPSMWKAHIGNGRAEPDEVTDTLRGLFGLEGSGSERLDSVGIAYAGFCGVRVTG